MHRRHFCLYCCSLRIPSRSLVLKSDERGGRANNQFKACCSLSHCSAWRLRAQVGGPPSSPRLHSAFPGPRETAGNHSPPSRLGNLEGGAQTPVRFGRTTAATQKKQSPTTYSPPRIRNCHILISDTYDQRRDESKTERSASAIHLIPSADRTRHACRMAQVDARISAVTLVDGACACLGLAWKKIGHAKCIHPLRLLRPTKLLSVIRSVILPKKKSKNQKNQKIPFFLDKRV